VHDEKPMNNTTVHARGGKTRVRTGSPAAVGSDGLLLARVSSSHGRRRGQEAERDSKDSCGRGDAGDQARCAPLYSYKPAITAGSGPTSPPFPVPVFLPHPAGEGRTRRSRSTEKKCWQRTHALCGGVARSRVVSGTCRSNGRTDGLPPA
jgi:hypothetical protein